jgi:hypothetical protein
MRIFTTLITLALLASCSTNTEIRESATGNPVEANESVEGFLSNSDSAAQAKDLKAFSSLVVEKDDFTSETYWNLPKNLEVKLDLKDMFLFDFNICQMGTCSKDKPELGLNIYYAAKDWLFIESAIFKLGDNTLEITPSQVSTARETLSAGYVFEAMSIGFQDREIEFFSKVFDDNLIKVRINGSGVKAEETELNALEIKGLKKLLLAYRHMMREGISAKSN